MLPELLFKVVTKKKCSPGHCLEAREDEEECGFRSCQRLLEAVEFTNARSTGQRNFARLQVDIQIMPLQFMLHRSYVQQDK
jgi:hypothetical protein